MIYTGVMIRDEIPRLRRYAMAVTGNKHSGDDLVQLCLRDALSAPLLAVPELGFRAWLFGILYRHQRDLPSGGISSSVELTNYGRTELMQLAALHQAVAELPRADREVLLLVAVAGLSYMETGGVLGVGVEVVRKRLSRSRSILLERWNVKSLEVH
ncbi:MAG: hypothetical protein LAT50_02835 [Ectothiorhodospiraceae bacterium]|nr:hypothetical protein [Ectothiorhodospiraceae bacterium]